MMIFMTLIIIDIKDLIVKIKNKRIFNFNNKWLEYYD